MWRWRGFASRQGPRERGVLWNSPVRLKGSGEATAAAAGADGGRG